MKLWNRSTTDKTAFDEHVGRGAHVKPGEAHDFSDQTANELLFAFPDVWNTKPAAQTSAPKKKKES